MKYYITKENNYYDLQASSVGIPTNAILQYPEERSLSDFPFLVITEIEKTREAESTVSILLVDENNIAILDENDQEQYVDHAVTIEETYLDYEISEDEDKKQQLILEQREAKLQQIRQQRDVLLSNSDKYILSDYPISHEERQLIIEYRQDLRNLPENLQDIDNPEFPVFPL